MAFLWLLSCLALLRASSGDAEPASQSELNIMPRIINGKDAECGAWPWHVVLLSPRGTPRCGGVLIRSNWVVTAAHCNISTAFKAVAGLYDRHATGDMQMLRIAQVFSHPLFNRSTLFSDITLLKLKTGAQFNSVVGPLSLPRADDIFPPTTWCSIIGCGHTKHEGSKYPDKLQQATVAVVDDDICKKYWPNVRLDVMFCTGLKGVSSSHGDSGGSLACQKNGVWTLAGIISYSRKTNPTKCPHVVTRVTAFIPWIEETLAHN